MSWPRPPELRSHGDRHAGLGAMTRVSPAPRPWCAALPAPRRPADPSWLLSRVSLAIAPARTSGCYRRRHGRLRASSCQPWLPWLPDTILGRYRASGDGPAPRQRTHPHRPAVGGLSFASVPVEAQAGARVEPACQDRTDDLLITSAFGPRRRPRITALTCEDSSRQYATPHTS
jgi:hypothetical protein